MVFKFQKPFVKNINSEAISEIDLDFNMLNAKDYIECISTASQDGEVDLSVAYKLGAKACRNILAKVIGCIPDFINDISLVDFRKLESECMKWFIESVSSNDAEFDFSKITTAQYIDLRSKDAINEVGNVGNVISAKSRLGFISVVTGKTQADLETLPAFEYIPMDIACANFFLIASLES